MKQQTYAQQLEAWRKRRERVLTLRRQGHDWPAIGKMLGVSPQRAGQLGAKADCDAGLRSGK